MFTNQREDRLMQDRSGAEHPRVLYFTDTYPPQVNGVSVVTELSVNGLRNRGWDCMVIAPEYPAIMPHGPLHRVPDPMVRSMPMRVTRCAPVKVPTR